MREPEVPEQPAQENPTAISGAQHLEDAKAPAHVPLVEEGEENKGDDKGEDDGFEKVEKVGEVPESEQKGAEKAVEDLRRAVDGAPLEERKREEE